MPAEGHLYRSRRLDDAVIGTVLIDQLTCALRISSLVRGPSGGSGRGSIGTANGWFSKVVNEGDILKE
jgi:hypothetical protein